MQGSCNCNELLRVTRLLLTWNGSPASGVGGQEPLGEAVVGRVVERVRDQVDLQVDEVTDSVEEAEESEEDPAGLVVAHVEVEGQEAVDSEPSEESQERAAHRQQEGAEAHSQALP